jgi:predicted nucleotidyltransferase
VISTLENTVPDDIVLVVNQCYSVLKGHYQEHLRDLVLYGSSARNQMTNDSDIDLLVILESPIDYLSELRVIVQLLYPIQLDSPNWISAKPASAEEFESGGIQLYRNILREGIKYVGCVN